ncbi:MAG: U32 family peptidase [Candidatus Gracilibacteria bacterium]|nr:U32 family peptidase [Candidatus Gracilibacteria bacterium]
MKFSIGYTSDGDFLGLIKKYKDNISSVYFSLEIGNIPSGRALDIEKTFEKNIIELLGYCKENDIETILTLNANCEGEMTGKKEQLDKIIKELEKYINYGLSSVTFVNLLYVSFIKDRFPNLKIYNSVNSNLNTIEQALFLKRLGVDILTINRDINRDIDLIKKIKDKTGLKIQIMLNEGCIRACPYRRSHFNLGAHASGEDCGDLFNSFACTYLFKKQRKYFFRVPFIRPEDLKYYYTIVDYYKLTTRGLSTIVIEKMLNAYIEEKYDGNLLDILDLYIDKFMRKHIGYIDNNLLTKYNFFERIKSCPGDCNNCNSCNIFLEKDV